MMILSGDPPRSRVLTLVLVLIILALVSNILLMVAILMWRPRGLHAVTSR